MKRLAFAPLVALICLALPACEEKAAPAAAPTSTAAAKTTAAAAAPADPPTEQDFEEQAEKEITSANLDSELDKLDKEIGQ